MSRIPSNLVVLCAVLSMGGAARGQSAAQALAELPSPPRSAAEASARLEGGVDPSLARFVRRSARVLSTPSQQGRRDCARPALATLTPDEIHALRVLREAMSEAEVVVPRRFGEHVDGGRGLLLDGLERIGEERRIGLVDCEGSASCIRGVVGRYRERRAALVDAHLHASALHWTHLREELAASVEQRERLAARIATASTDACVRDQAEELERRQWAVVARLADEVSRETRIAAGR